MTYVQNIDFNSGILSSHENKKALSPVTFSYFSEHCTQKRRLISFKTKFQLNQELFNFTVRMCFILYIKKVSEYLTLPPLQLIPGA